MFIVAVCLVLWFVCLMTGWNVAAKHGATAFQRVTGGFVIALGVGFLLIAIDRFMTIGNGGEYNSALTRRVSERIGANLSYAGVDEMRLVWDDNVFGPTIPLTRVTFDDGVTVDVGGKITTASGDVRLLKRTVFWAMQDASGERLTTYRLYVDLSESPENFEDGATSFVRAIYQALESATAERAKHDAAEQAKATWGN
jgi:hypothetical protein